jgi:RNA polymerase sigma factor (sigma-70 family)
MTTAYAPDRADQHHGSPTQADHAELPLASLLCRCREELGRFLRGEASDDQFMFELWGRAVERRDLSAWEGLFELLRPQLLAWFRRKGASSEVAEDALQETFLVLWTKSNSGAFTTRNQTLRQVLAYLYGGAQDALTKVRRQLRDGAAPGDQAALLTVSRLADASAVEQQLDAAALRARIRALLPEREWHILWKRWGEAIPPRELGPLLGLSVGEIHTTLASTKRRLRNDRRLLSFVRGESAGL